MRSLLFIIVTVLSIGIGRSDDASPLSQTKETPVKQIDSKSQALTGAVRTALKARNPRIERVAIVELRSFAPDGPHVLIGSGVRGDLKFEGSFDDELFGVFLVDGGWTRIEATLDILPTPRWLDYRPKIDRLTKTELVIVGSGSTYGDQPLRRVYDLRLKK